MTTRLEYTIHSSSGHTSTFKPELVLTDEPHDQSSRWTGATAKPGDELKSGYPPILSPSTTSSTPSTTAAHRSGDSLTIPTADPHHHEQPQRPTKRRKREVQYITIKLDKPSIVHRVGFGKYQKVHPCNLFEFTIAGGMSPDPRYMEPLLYAGLRNDTTKEVFDLPTTVESSTVHRETTTTHLMLAHLRRTGQLSSFSTLESTSPSYVTKQFEHPLLSNLHQSLVIKGNFLQTEQILNECLQQGLLNDWNLQGTKGTAVAKWSIVSQFDQSKPNLVPSPRAGHQLVRVGRTMLLFGGWDGEKDLGDLWQAELPRTSHLNTDNDEDDQQQRQQQDETLIWRLLEPQPKVETDERPRARSCHQMAVDETQGWVYLLGGKLPYTNPTAATNNGMSEQMDVEPSTSRHTATSLNPESSDFWRYKTHGSNKGTWELLSKDTEQDKGPSLLFDHQMVIDQDLRMLFVFGGKTQSNSMTATSGDDMDNRHSGFYCYDLDSQQWSRLFGDPTSGDSFKSERLLSRFGHQMLYDAELSTMFILSGQRGETYLSDLWSIKLMNSDRRSSATTATNGQRDTETDDDPTEVWRAGGVVGSIDNSSSSSSTGTTTTTPSITTAVRASRAPTILQIKRVEPDYSSYGPPAAFTQRSTIDPQTGTWTLISGLIKDRTTLKESTVGELWTRTRQGQWNKVETKSQIEPCGRYASQVVWDPLTKCHYLHGGNPSQNGDEPRLGDCWKLKIVSPSPQEAVRRAKFLVRKQRLFFQSNKRFTEMCQTRPTLMALDYLQTTLSSVVDHSDQDEANQFRQCMTSLLSAPPKNNCDVTMSNASTSSLPSHHAIVGDNVEEDGSTSVSNLDEVSTTTSSSTVSLNEEEPISIQSNGSISNEVKTKLLYQQRQELFEKLMEFMMDNETQPKLDLIDLANKRDYV
ncbi:hypothetical protein OIO90_003549 [Microbotryomycetes sp. JL221]|nr:hypothetical protein OIO90_003549 [Microbotryomycetes sp. JL221]